jgi:transcription elongation factor Elf1
MKRYDLTCLECGTEKAISINLSSPEILYCETCECDFDIDRVEESIKKWQDTFANWREYVKDLKELLEIEMVVEMGKELK